VSHETPGVPRKHPDRNHAQIGASRFGLPQPLRGFAVKCTAPVLGTLVPCSL